MSNSDQVQKNDNRRIVRLVVFAIAVILLVWFVISNSQKVEVNFWVTSAQTSLIAVILISAALGAIISLILARRHR